jgi:hypothetical protein
VEYQPAPTTEVLTAAPATMVVVTTDPGPALPLETLDLGPRDEVDQIVQDVFGDPITDKPGRLDVVLVVIGIAVIAWALLALQSVVLAAIGVVVLLLGLAVPLSNVRRSRRQRQTAAQRSKLMASGTPLDVSQLPVALLLREYEDLVSITAGSTSTEVKDALLAGHAALLEVAWLLQGHAPTTPAEVEYINKRTEAVHNLVRTLHARDHEQVLAGDAAAVAFAESRAKARIEQAEPDEQSSLQAINRSIDRLQQP